MEIRIERYAVPFLMENFTKTSPFPLLACDCQGLKYYFWPSKDILKSLICLRCSLANQFVLGTSQVAVIQYLAKQLKGKGLFGLRISENLVHPDGKPWQRCLQQEQEAKVFYIMTDQKAKGTAGKYTPKDSPPIAYPLKAPQLPTVVLTTGWGASTQNIGLWCTF